MYGCKARTPAMMDRALAGAEQNLLSYGLTAVNDMGTSPAGWSACCGTIPAPASCATPTRATRSPSPARKSKASTCRCWALEASEAGAAGQTGEKNTWGKPAAWCDISGRINGKPYGVATLDGFGAFDRPALCAAGGLLAYLDEVARSGSIRKASEACCVSNRRVAHGGRNFFGCNSEDRH